ncbi:Ubiquinol-cytochrome C reductase, UQCRX/QCR9 like domain containing protein [Rhypophila sp. PSN 637]|uniref:Complex III subunit 9 n=1 Tax=Rhypophila decipiens TaxID=261697 RepID=A0AAN6YLW5_9PEZI|nr:ubiquinol-cytochrome C reductase [Rhypophila decipiens]
MAVAPRPFLYNALFKKNYVMLGVVFAGAFGWEMFYDTTMNKVWDYNNRGRQWKDIRHKYVEASEDDE